VKRLKVVGLLLVLAAMASAVLAADTIAYNVPAGTAGNQNFTGSLGMDFDIVSDIVVTHLGVFDDGTDGLQAPLQARLYQRDDANPCNTKLLATIDFPLDDQGTDMGDGSLYKKLANPITLSAGFTCCIVASGYGPLEQNGNLGVVNAGTWDTDDGGGLINFVGKGRFGDPNHPEQYPMSVDGGPPNRYAAGTFVYHAP
jgi:hypothetical protein